MTTMVPIQRRSTLAVLLGCLILSACGGGGDSAPSNPSPGVSSVSPADGATGVTPDTAVRATFSTDMFATTIADSSFHLREGGTGIASTVSYDPLTREATLTPSARLKLLTQYTASLSSDITDLSGNPLAAKNWSFTTRDGVWGSEQFIETYNSGDAWYPQIAMDGVGNGLAIWLQDGAAFGTYHLMANHYRTDTGWGLAEMIGTITAVGVGNINPRVAMDREGNAMVVWVQEDNFTPSIWAKHYTRGVGWGLSELLERDNTGDAGTPTVTFDANGNAIAVWYQQDSSTFANIYANRYAPDVGWGTAELIETDNAGSATNPKIAFDSEGNAIVVWQQFDGTSTNIRANRYAVDWGWSAATIIENDNRGSATRPEIAFDTAGNAIAVWQQSDGTVTSIWANRYTIGSGWGAAVTIESDNAGNAIGPKIVLDSNGNGIAVWHQSDGVMSSVWTNRFSAGNGWGVAEKIENDDSGSAAWPEIAMDEKGNAMAVWQQSDGVVVSVWANRFTVGSGWESARLIESDDVGHANASKIAIDKLGRAVAVWMQSNGTVSNILANRFE